MPLDECEEVLYSNASTLGQAVGLRVARQKIDWTVPACSAVSVAEVVGTTWWPCQRECRRSSRISRSAFRCTGPKRTYLLPAAWDRCRAVWHCEARKFSDKRKCVFPLG